MKTLIFLLFFLLFATPISAQLRLDDEGYRRTRLLFGTRSSEPGDAKTLIGPGVFPLAQGNTSTCGGYAIAAAAGIRFMLYCNGRYETNHPMPEFSGLYSCCKTDHTLPDSGFSMQHLFDILTRYGIPLAKHYPNDPLGCPDPITPAVDSLAAQFRLWKYARIFDLAADACPRSDSACLARHRQSLYENTIAAIDAPLPVIVVLAVPPGFEQLQGGDCTLTALPPTNVEPTYHAVVVTGYDDKRKVFQILNSYGKDWGCEGLAYLDYDLFKNTARYGYVLEWTWDFVEETPCDAAFRK